MKLRIKFKKHGPVRFIGHLDVMRYFQKAIRRAGIDVTYSAGFSPHQVMSFAAPLGVGIESNGEYMDIQVNSLPIATADMTSCELLVRQLNAVGVSGLEAVSARILPENAGNAMASVAAAAYTVRFREGREPSIVTTAVPTGTAVLPTGSAFVPADTASVPTSADTSQTDNLQSALDAFLSREEIPITKETKRGVREVNLRPGIYELDWYDDAFHMLLDASSAGNIKPIHVMEAFFADCGEVLQENALLVTREDVYTYCDSQDSQMECSFVSLGEIGGAL